MALAPARDGGVPRRRCSTTCGGCGRRGSSSLQAGALRARGRVRPAVGGSRPRAVRRDRVRRGDAGHDVALALRRRDRRELRGRDRPHHVRDDGRRSSARARPPGPVPRDGGLFAAAAGATVGLAAWNATPARVFAGDAGTHLLGFLVGSLACSTATGPTHALPWPLAAAPLLPGRRRRRAGGSPRSCGAASPSGRRTTTTSTSGSRAPAGRTRRSRSATPRSSRPRSSSSAASAPTRASARASRSGAVILGAHLLHGAAISRRAGVRDRAVGWPRGGRVGRRHAPELRLGQARRARRHGAARGAGLAGARCARA